MTSEKKAEANRRNALKSTGPKTPEGKARASRNATKHGVLVAAPVVREMERPEDWTSHLSGVRTSLAAVGYLEEVLVDRVALHLWRMGRVARFETEALSAGMETAERAVNEDPRRSGDFPSTLKAKMEAEGRAFRTLARLEADPPDDEVDQVDAEAVLLTLDASTESRLQDEQGEVPSISIPGVPDDEDGREDFDAWTVGLLLGAVDAYAKATGWTRARIIESAAAWAKWEGDQAERSLAAHGNAVARKKGERLLLDPKVLDRVLRYETTMERAFLRTLHELQRLQAARKGGSVPPPLALDVDLSPSSGAGLEP